MADVSAPVVRSRSGDSVGRWSLSTLDSLCGGEGRESNPQPLGATSLPFMSFSVKFRFAGFPFGSQIVFSAPAIPNDGAAMTAIVNAA